MTASHAAAVSPLPPVVVPAGARPCRRCGIRMPIVGVSAVSAANPTLCTECAGEGAAPTLPELLVRGELPDATPEKRQRFARLDVTAEIAAEWAALRRAGLSYDAIGERSSLNPTHRAVSYYLKKFGYDSDGTFLEETDMPRQKRETSEADALPFGWGAIERDVVDPARRGLDIYTPVIERLCDEATAEWARVLAPNKHRAGTLVRLLKDHPTLAVQAKTVEGRQYIYFRLKPSANGSQP